LCETDSDNAPYQGVSGGKATLARNVREDTQLLASGAGASDATLFQMHQVADPASQEEYQTCARHNEFCVHQDVFMIDPFRKQVRLTS
jgi:hypothetical protein